MFTPYPIELWKAKHIYSNYLAKYLQAKIGREKSLKLHYNALGERMLILLKRLMISK
jgi:hypothetical protein